MPSSCYNCIAMLSAFVRPAMVICAMFAGACSLAVDPDQVQCEVAADCAAIDSPDSRCIDNLCTGSFKFDCSETPWIDENAANKVDVTITGRTRATVGVDGLLIDACDNSACDPVAASAVATGADGRATLSVSEGFRGRFEFPASPDPEADDANAAYIVQMHPPPNPSVPATLSADVVVISLKEVSLIAGLLDVVYDDTLGHLFFSVRDCQGDVLENATVQVVNAGPDVRVVYLGTNLNPDLSLSETGAQGGGAIVNIPTGLTAIAAYHHGVKIFQQTLIFASGEISSTQIVPSDF